MSAFNILTAAAECPVCKKVSDFDIQFKYGDTWQHRYKLGDHVRWGQNDIGLPDCAQVVVEGIGGPCSQCDTDNIEFDIVLKNDSLSSLSVIGLERSSFRENGYQVVDD